MARICRICPNAIAAHRTRALYCSPACRLRAQKRANPEKTRATRRFYRAKRESLYRAFADAAKASGCVDCGNKHLGVLQLDHVRGEKRFAISRLPNVPLREFLSELDKCEPRCANCHQLVSRSRRVAA